MRKFNKGDRVKYIGYLSPELKDKFGTIADIEGVDNIFVKWDDGSSKRRAVVPESLELASAAISIKPAQKAEIVGAKIGDRVAYTDLYGDKVYGEIRGIDVDRVAVLPEGPLSTRYIAPHRLTLAPKQFAVGDRVSGADYDILPNGTVCAGDKHWVSVIKVSGTWMAVRPTTLEAVRNPGITERTIADLPRGYAKAAA